MGKVGRNDPCPCGSGLKVKSCHGDPIIQRDSTIVAKAVATLFVTERMHERDLVTGEDTVEMIGKMVDQANNYLPRCVKLVSSIKVEPQGSGEKEADEADEKAGSKPADLDGIQQGMVPCPTCGRRLPAGMKCYKCNSEEKECPTS